MLRLAVLRLATAIGDSPWRFRLIVIVLALFAIDFPALGLLLGFAFLFGTAVAEKLSDVLRPPDGHCQSCGYDLTGNVSGVCPECGERI